MCDARTIQDSVTIDVTKPLRGLRFSCINGSVRPRRLTAISELTPVIWEDTEQLKVRATLVGFPLIRCIR